LFRGAKDIQVWLNTCARLIARSIPPERLADASGDRVVGHLKDERRKPVVNRLTKEQMTTVVWTTPLGLPIVQPYRKTKRKQIMTALQTVYISDPNSPAEGKTSSA
jgi:DNA-directed RNA polymerase